MTTPEDPFATPPADGTPPQQPPPSYPQQPPPGYAQQPPAYGAPPPAYGAPYGAPAPPYGAPAPPYGAPPPAYGAPPVGYAGPGTPGPGITAGMGQRLVARIIDGALLGVITIVIASAVGLHVFHTTTNADGTKTASFSAYNGQYFKLAAISLITGSLYEVSLIALRGATLGKMALGIKVVHGMEGRLPGWQPAFIRWVTPAVSGLLFPLLELLVFISPFFDSTGRRQGWHDKAAGTFVIRAR